MGSSIVHVVNGGFTVGINKETQKAIDKDIEENPELYKALADTPDEDNEIHLWKEWIECPNCGEKNDVGISIRPRSVGFWCGNCDTTSFYNE